MGVGGPTEQGEPALQLLSCVTLGMLFHLWEPQFSHLGAVTGVRLFLFYVCVCVCVCINNKRKASKCLWEAWHIVINIILIFSYF